MTDPLFVILKVLTLLGCGLAAGVFFAFSTFVMAALARLAPPQGIAAMQLINITVINPWFMTVFLGTAAISVVVAIAALLTWPQPGAAACLVGGLVYLVGTFGVTLLGNVPLNNTLAIASPENPASAALWATYLSRWTLWNHIRTIAAAVATVALALSLYQSGPGQ